MGNQFEFNIPFTQYLLPNGRRKDVTITRPREIHEKAMAIIAAGYRFEIVILQTGVVSMTVTGPDADGDEEDLDIELVKNGPGVPVAVDRMITRFYQDNGIGKQVDG